MKRLYSGIVLLLILTTLTNCGKDSLFDCFKSAAKTVTEERTAVPFNYIILKNNLNLYITQDSRHSIRVEAGKNLQNGIKTDIINNTLTISNENRCNWIRSYDKPLNVYVSVVILDSIQYRSSGDIQTLNTIINDSIKLDVCEGGGSIYLHLNTIKSRLSVHNCTVDLTVAGVSTVNFISSNGYGPVYCLDLDTKYTYMNNNSTNDCYVRASIVLDAKIENAGNIYYAGNPTITAQITGSGKLIKLD
jgi:hypothetical protein